MFIIFIQKYYQPACALEATKPISSPTYLLHFHGALHAILSVKCKDRPPQTIQIQMPFYALEHNLQTLLLYKIVAHNSFLKQGTWKHNKKIIGKLFTQLHSTLLMLMIFSMAASSPQLPASYSYFAQQHLALWQTLKQLELPLALSIHARVINHLKALFWHSQLPSSCF